MVGRLQTVPAGEDDLPLAQRLAAFPWVGDDITAIEGRAIYGLHELAEKDLALAQQLLELSWVPDGMTENEASAIGSIADLASKDPEGAWARLEQWQEDDS